MIKNSPYDQAVERLASHPIVTIATGATCAYLGDERNLREFLIADETARRLRIAGHTVFTLLIDDSLDPLNFRQLRVAVDKDPELMERYMPWCGRPISLLPDPWGCHDSYAAHFEQKLLDRLHTLDCHPALISTASLYRNGVYAPYVREILERHDEVLDFLRGRFPDYTPDKLFWVLCPDCGYIDETRIESIAPPHLDFSCGRCARKIRTRIDGVQGKFNWKLDCALRWAIFNIHAEPFSKAYLEPQAGSFVVAQALSEQFFQGHQVLPLHYGTIKMDRSISYKLLGSLPPAALRALLVARPTTDLTLTHDVVIASASQHEALPGLSFLEVVRQMLPLWLLTPQSLSTVQRDLLSRGVVFSKHFLNEPICFHFPTRESLHEAAPGVVYSLSCLLSQVIALRQNTLGAEPSQEAIKVILSSLGPQKKTAYHCLRQLTGQEHGLPITRLLVALPLTYVQLLVDLMELHLDTLASPASQPFLRVAA